jgi:Skp family chaperone for outer membrane proteins
MAVLQHKRVIWNFGFALLLCVWLLTGCGKEEDSGLSRYQEEITALQQTINTMQLKIDALHRELEVAQAAVASKPMLLLDLPEQPAERDSDEAHQAVQTIAADPNANTSPLLAIIDEAMAGRIQASGDAEAGTGHLQRLQHENATLKKELERLRAKLAELTSSTRLAALAPAQSREQILNEWSLQRSPTRQIAYIESLSELSAERDPAVFPVIEQAINNPDPEVAVAASDLLADYKSPEVLPVVEKALLSPNEEVRMNALEPLDDIDSADVADVMAIALNDDSQAVREKALETIDLQEGNVQLDCLWEAMLSDYQGVKTEALSMLELRGDHPTVPIIIEGLKDTNPEYRQEVNSVLSFLIDQEFDSYDAAAQWWSENQNRYDDDLFEK